MTMSASNAKHHGQLAASVEYTDLRKTITYRDVETMCTEAEHFGFAAVVIPSALVRHAIACLGGDGPAVVTVISYPFGTQSPTVKAREAAAAVDHGAHELDVVPHFGAILSQRWAELREELDVIRKATGHALLKLVLESERLTEQQLRRACAEAEGAGFEYVVNTLGFRIVSTDPEAEGTASAPGIASLRAHVGGTLKIKAAGGVASREAVGALLDAGASRVAMLALPGLARSMGRSGDREGVSP